MSRNRLPVCGEGRMNLTQRTLEYRQLEERLGGPRSSCCSSPKSGFRGRLGFPFPQSARNHAHNLWY